VLIRKAILVSMVIFIFPLSAACGVKSVGLASGNLATADVCGMGVGFLGLGVGVGDEATAVFGMFTYGFSDYTEGRLKFGFSDADVPSSDPVILFGFDFKYEFMDYYDMMRQNPFDLAFGAFMEYVDYEGASVFEGGVNTIGSIPYSFQSGRKLVPYLRLNLRLEKYSGNGDSESNFRFGANVGTKFEVSSEFNAYGEFQLDGNIGFYLGAEIRVF